MASRSPAHFLDRPARRAGNPTRRPRHPATFSPLYQPSRSAPTPGWLWTAGALLLLFGGCIQGRPFRLNTVGLPPGDPNDVSCVAPAGPHAGTRSEAHPEAAEIGDADGAANASVTAAKKPSAAAAGASADAPSRPRPRARAAGRRGEPKRSTAPSGKVTIPALTGDPFADGPPGGSSSPSAAPATEPRPRNEDHSRPPEPPADSPPRLVSPDRDRGHQPAAATPAARRSGTADSQRSSGDHTTRKETPQDEAPPAANIDKPANADRATAAGGLGHGAVEAGNAESATRGTDDGPGEPVRKSPAAEGPPSPPKADGTGSEHPARDRKRNSRTIPETPKPLRVELPPLDAPRSPLDDDDELRRRLRALRRLRSDRTEPPTAVFHLDAPAATSGSQENSDPRPLTVGARPRPEEARNEPAPSHARAIAHPAPTGEPAGLQAARDTTPLSPFETSRRRNDAVRATVPSLDAPASDGRDEVPPEHSSRPDEPLPLIVPLPLSSGSRRTDPPRVRSTPAEHRHGSPVRLVKTLVPIPAGAASHGRALVNAVDASDFHACCQPDGRSSGSPTRGVLLLPSDDSERSTARAAGDDVRSVLPTSMTSPPAEGTKGGPRPDGSQTHSAPATDGVAGDGDEQTFAPATGGPATADAGPELSAPFTGPSPTGRSAFATDALIASSEYRPHPSQSGITGETADATPAAAERVAAPPARSPASSATDHAGSRVRKEASREASASAVRSSEPADDSPSRENQPPRWTLFLAFAGAGALIAAICRRWIPDTKRRHAA